MRRRFPLRTITQGQAEGLVVLGEHEIDGSPDADLFLHPAYGPAQSAAAAALRKLAARQAREAFASFDEIDGIYISSANSWPILKYPEGNDLGDKVSAIAWGVFPEPSAYIRKDVVNATICQERADRGGALSKVRSSIFRRATDRQDHHGAYAERSPKQSDGIRTPEARKTGGKAWNTERLIM